MAQYSANRQARAEQLRQNLEQGPVQAVEAHERPTRAQIAQKSDKNDIKNSVISSYDKEIQNLSSIERLKYEYGVEKNVVLSRDNVEQNRELIQKYIEYFSAYADIFLDLITPAESKFKLYFYQRINKCPTLL